MMAGGGERRQRSQSLKTKHKEKKGFLIFKVAKEGQTSLKKTKNKKTLNKKTPIAGNSVKTVLGSISNDH